MGSKGRIPPHLRRPLPGPGLMHPDMFGPGARLPPGAYHSFDAGPPVEVLEQKLDAQLVEMQALAKENQRLGATHGSLRHELAAAQQELQRIQVDIGAMKNERERHMRGLMDKISNIEAELRAVEPLKIELQQAHAEAQSLVTARQELMNKVQQLTMDLQRTHSEVQVPALISELETLRQDYQHCRATFDYEKKVYNEHYESLQAMENNYLSMARELEKLRAELANTSNLERNSASYGGATGYPDKEAAGNHPYGAPTAYKEAAGNNPYGAPTAYKEAAGNNPYGAPTGYKENEAAAAQHSYGGPTGYKENEAGGRHPYGGPTGYKENEVSGHHSYGAPAGYKENEAAAHYPYGSHMAHKENEGVGHPPAVQNAYDDGYGAPPQVRGAPLGAPPPPYGGPGAAPAWAGYDAQRGAVYDAQRGPGYGGPGYEAPPRSGAGPQGQMNAPANTAAYGSVTPPTRAVGGYEPPTRGNMTGR